MSYCRLGPDCDVYCYGSGSEGYTIHLADGPTFHDSTLSALYLRLRYLRTQGYRVPDGVFKRIVGELSQESLPDESLSGGRTWLWFWIIHLIALLVAIWILWG